MFRPCGNNVTRKCSCCGLWLCCSHHHDLETAEKLNTPYRAGIALEHKKQKKEKRMNVLNAYVVEILDGPA